MTSATGSTILVIGVDPATLDPAAWGMTPDEIARVQHAIAAAEQGFRDAGHAVRMCLIALDADLDAVLVPPIRAERWNVVVIGGGLRKPPELLLLFERVVNLVHRHAPQAAIAFNATLADIQAAAERWSGKDPWSDMPDPG